MKNLLKLSKRLDAIDGSCNLIFNYGKSVLESRYVRRSPNYVSLYLSSHNGCTMGCRFCWLTQQKLNSFSASGLDIYRSQTLHLLDVIPEKDHQNLLKNQIKININLMARGEPLANPTIINSYQDFYKSLEKDVIESGYKEVKINLSTIMPHTVRKRNLIDIFKDNPVSIYYSLYSPNETFRKKWLPNAIPYQTSLDKIKKYQEDYYKLTTQWAPLTFHWAVIKGQNDDIEENLFLQKEILERDFKNLKFNLVRYNPPEGLPIEDSQEVSDETLKTIFHIFESISNIDEKGNQSGNHQGKGSTKRNLSRIVDRVGKDAFISCGMFPNY
jgi:adenine C2-methylase RlmN of 23S rRNA A2503 and tRNA A37